MQFVLDMAHRVAHHHRVAAILILNLAMLALSCRAEGAAPTPVDLLDRASTIVFLGDSITYSGRYVAYFDAWLLSRSTPRVPTVINAGLSSETVSGLSEDGHARGRFPRPVLAERLERVLAATAPDIVVACYGINCGIYQPFDSDRFEKYQQGVRELQALVEKRGATLVVITPPFYDDRRGSRSFSYNAVLDRYSDWLVERRKDHWLVVDLHGPMTREVARRRMADRAFTFEPDGVHPNAEGHWFMAQQLIGWFGDEAAAAAASPEGMLALRGTSPSALPLVEKRMEILRDAWLTKTGHKRPGVPAGLPIDEAAQEAAELTKQIQALVKADKP